ncbi:GOLD domain [Trypanosoma melophagium]|uniref:GOLD domain n=1 Tax=Trypanosoma melophagium TaxID=715481 RepID=UPI003519EEE0|nr:GOLD domain [Trypanosoma melophagium]
MPRVKRPTPLPLPLSLLLLLLLLLLLVDEVAGSAVYVKLFPGREFCVSYEGRRDPEEDPPTVDIRHRALDPRNVNVRTRLYGPNGAQLLKGDRIDPFGLPASIFFKVTETGTYRLCMRTPLSHPPLRFEMRFVGEKDLVEPATTTEGTEVVDKPVGVEDYKERLNMLDICVQVTLDEVRMSENRLYMLDEVTKSTYYRVVGMLILNVTLAIGLSVWAEKYLERYFTKKKLV